MSGSLYLEDVMLLANNGEREEGAGICGIILWNEELEKDTQRMSWVGNELLEKTGKGQTSLVVLGELQEVTVTSIQGTY